jgi:hypothetical protein
LSNSKEDAQMPNLNLNRFLSLFSKSVFISAASFSMSVVLVQTTCASSEKSENHSAAPPFRGEKVLSKSSCKLTNAEFNIILTSPSGESIEDDTTLWFTQQGQVMAANRKKLGYIAFIPVSSTVPSICDTAAAFPLPKGRIAVPLFLSNRPDLDLLAVAVYDPHRKVISYYAVLERYYGEMPTLAAIKGGFSFMAVSAQPNDSPEGLVETWMNVTWDGKKTLKKWNRSRGEVRH